MADRIKLVQGDTLPALVVTLYDENTGDIVDLTGASVRMLFREMWAETVKATLPGVLVGDPPGATGQVAFGFGDSLDAPGNYEGEFEVTFPGGGVQTTYAVQKFKVRPQF